MEDHVNSVVKSCFFQLRQLPSIRRSLSTDARKALVHFFVASRIDHCNAILHGASDDVVRRMQTALKAAARFVVDAGRRQHMTPILQSMHWLPVKQRIFYKIGIISFHCVCGDGPAYLTEMFSRVSDTFGRANLRSAARGDFVIPRTNTMTFGPRSFRVSGPTFWNMLPLDMRDMNISTVTFKSKLKTFLVMRAFPGAFETWLMGALQMTVYTYTCTYYFKRAVWWKFIATAEMRRITPDGDEVVQKIYLRSEADDLFSGDDIAEAIDQGINRLLENLSTFESQGSGWTLVAGDRLYVSTAQFNPIGGSSYIPSPERIANTQTCINVRNEDVDVCFLYSIAASVLNLNKNAERPSKYRVFIPGLKTDGLRFLLPLYQIPNFERLNPKYSVNVFYLDDETSTTMLLKVTKCFERQHHVDMLLLAEDDKRYYILSKN